jgi:hypothetical protein
MLLFTKGQRITQIDQYHRHIGTTVASFQAGRCISIASLMERMSLQDISTGQYSCLAGEE